MKNKYILLMVMFLSGSLLFADGGYTSDGEFAPIEVGVSASNEKYSCSWILNPDSGLAFLVVGLSL